MTAAIAARCAMAAGPSMMPSANTRYATDAYPGFDREENIIVKGKKTPRWFSWINGPAKKTASEQLAYAIECEKAESWRAARRGYDSLVREWPASPEAPIAQEKLADLQLGHYADYEEAFEEYRYLMDYYSSQCNYSKIAERLYEVALLMEEEGAQFLFFHLPNTVDVRRAFEGVVLRSPGAKFVPAAMLKIAKLREDADEYDKAVTVYENLRNLHPYTEEAEKSLVLEGAARMKLLKDHGYNRTRVKDTVEFLKMALANNPSEETKKALSGWYEEAVLQLEEEAYKSAKFYDAKTSTRHGAIAAYENFLREYPASRYAEVVSKRIAELKAAGDLKK